MYSCYGLMVGAISLHELEGIFLIVLLANIDVGWLQNPSYYIVYLAYPVALPRPQLGDSLAEMVLSIEHSTGFQPGANKLPSLHVSFAWFVCFACRGQKLNKFGESVVFLIAVMITVSTLFLKQHVVLDAATGVLLAVLTWKLASV